MNLHSTSSASNQYNSLAEFLAHALALEMELEENLLAMAEGLETHHNDRAARLLRQQAKEIAGQIQVIEAAADDVVLPELAPWDYPWNTQPDVFDHAISQCHYLMSERDVLQIILPLLQMARSDYARHSQHSRNAQVKKLARQLADHKHAQIQNLTQRLRNLPPIQRPQDLDPPNTPE